MSHSPAPLILLFGVAVACDPCQRAGCDALNDRAAAAEGIAGVVATQSDVVEDGCAECPEGQAQVEVWPVGSASSSEAELAELVETTAPSRTVEANGHYDLGLSAGDYVVCVRASCIAVTVAPGATTTVNIKQRYGPSSFFVADPASNSLREDYGFEVSLERFSSEG